MENAIKMVLKEMVREGVMELGGGAFTKILLSGLSMFEVIPGAKDLALLLDASKAVQAGNLFELLVTRALCDSLAAAGGGDQLWFEVPINPGNGKPSGNGYPCGPTGGRSSAGEGFVEAFPDFLVSRFQPEKLRPKLAIKSFVIGDVKLGVSTAYNKWRKKGSQYQAIGKHAREFQYAPLAVTFTFKGPKYRWHEAWIKRHFWSDFRVVMFVFDVRR